MPFPFLLAALFVASKVVKTSTEISANQRAAKIARQQGELEGQLFGKNADLADEQAADAIARGQEAYSNQRAKMRNLTGEQNATISAGGTTLGVGSSARAVASDVQIGEQDSATIRRNAAREALGYSRQADISRMQGSLARAAGRNTSKLLKWRTYSSLANFGGDLVDLYNMGH